MNEDQRSFLAWRHHDFGLPLLLYGLLRLPAVFRHVVGRDLAGCMVESIDLPDYEVRRMRLRDHPGDDRYGDFPGLFPCAPGSVPGVSVACLLVTDLPYQDMRRIAWYEWDEYRLHRMTLPDGRAAQLFLPSPDILVTAPQKTGGALPQFMAMDKGRLDQHLRIAGQWMALLPPEPGTMSPTVAVSEQTMSLTP